MGEILKYSFPPKKYFKSQLEEVSCTFLHGSLYLLYGGDIIIKITVKKATNHKVTRKSMRIFMKKVKKNLDQTKKMCEHKILSPFFQDNFEFKGTVS
jgi:hypothetical protein